MKVDRKTIEEVMRSELIRSTRDRFFDSMSAATANQTTSESILEDIKIAVDDIGKSNRCNHFGFSDPFDFAGFRIFEEPSPPQKIKLSDNVDVSDDFRKEFDSWLLSEFGRQDPLLKRNQFMVMEGMRTVISPYGCIGVLSTIVA